MAFIYPVNAPVSQPFGVNPNSFQPQGHYGIDFACAVGTDIRAIGDGVVRWADWNQKLGANQWMIIPGATGSGIFVVIDHGNGYVSLYCHLDSTPMNVGQRVTAGSIIGKSGNTGNSTGPHLHLEVVLMRNINGYRYGRIDPASVMSHLQTVGSTITTPNQRKVGSANLNQRAEPKTSARVVRVVPGNTIETFTGYVHGEMVNSGGVKSNIWYKDNQGYVWSGGFTTQTGTGLVNETPKALAPNQRMVIAGGAIQRSAPDRTGAVLRNIKGNTIEVFSGYVHGEKISSGGITSDVWFRDSVGYVWCGGFTSQSTSGLPNQTPVKGTRISGPSQVAYRKTPKLDGEIDRYLPANTSFVFDAYTRGDTFAGSNIWFRGRENKFWAHSRLFTSQSTDGLTEIKFEEPEKAPSPVPPVSYEREVVDVGVRVRTVPSTAGSIKSVAAGGTKVSVNAYVDGAEVSGSKLWFEIQGGGYVHVSGLKDGSTTGLLKREAPAEAPHEDGEYSFTPDFDFVEYAPANTWNMQDGNFPTDPAKIVIHQFDEKDKRPSLDGVISWFQTPRKDKPSSAHFAVSGDRIVQLVSLKDRAQHAGPVGNDYIGIEVDPQEDPKTVASVKKLISALNHRYGKVFAYTKHRDVPENSTECGKDINLNLYKVDPAPKPEKPTPVPPVRTEPTKEEVQFVLDYLIRYHSK